ncbi:MAG TPA: Hsp33 family molecular chaperone HslO [Atribacteraceae bacterium]|nr:Hsp33 family molecular chaperone HslO [Atribacteraceae bacterium]
MHGRRDYLIRYVLDDSPVNGTIALTSGLVEDARVIHGTSPVATAALGRALTLAGVMGATLKDAGKVTFQIQCTGPLRSLVSQGNSRGEVRGYVSQPLIILPSRESGKLNVEEAVGVGSQLVVVKDLATQESTTGSVEVRHGGIAADLASYFVRSEQIPTACAAGVLVERDGTVLAAGGFLVHSPSGTPPEHIRRIEENISQLDQVSALVSSGLEVDGIAGLLFAGLSYHEVGRQELAYRCPCSRTRAERALMLLGRVELVKLIEGEGHGEISCPFCNEIYLFTREELERLSYLAEQSGERLKKRL